MGGPNLTTSYIAGGSSGVLQSGSYKVKAQYNQAGTSSPYGKYLQIMFNWKNYASDAAQSLQWAQDALLKITFFGVVRPDPTLGTIVNLDRYYLGNTVFSSTPNSELACGVTVDDISKQQKVYMPNTIPGLYRTDITMALEYGNNNIYPSTTSNYGTRLYKAYKYTSSPRRYQFAYCTDWDYANNIMTFISYDESGNAIEKWTLDYTTYGSNVWTTTPISSGSTYTAGTGISIDANDVISVTGMATEVELQSVSASIPTLPEEISLVAGQNISIAVTGASAVISSTGGGGGSNYTAGDFIDITNNEISVTDTTSVVAGDGISITQSGDTTTISLGVTAGITDIQVVNSLPASPVSTVLYLIPES
jgi:hypothetical protein